MLCVPFARLTAAALVLLAIPAAAEPITLDLRGAIDRAQRAAPEAIAARGRIADAEAGERVAGVAFTANPVLEAGAGLAWAGARPIDGELRLEQELEPGRRGPRRQLARAQVELARGEAAVAARQLERDVALAFYAALHAERSVELAARAAELALRGQAVAERRRRAGEITDLEATLAASALGRARSAIDAATGERDAALGALAQLIGAAPDDALVLRGDLRPPPLAAPPPAASRADVRALDRERDAAIAEHAQAVAHGRPALAISLGYQRDDAADLVVAGLRVSLPAWNRGRGEQAVARAKQHRASATRDATLRRADREVADARRVYADAARALATFERDVVPTLDDSERLLERTLDAGQLAIPAYLVARQELLAGRREHLDRLLAVARASVAAAHAAGVSP